MKKDSFHTYMKLQGLIIDGKEDKALQLFNSKPQECCRNNVIDALGQASKAIGEDLKKLTEAITDYLPKLMSNAGNLGPEQATTLEALLHGNTGRGLFLSLLNNYAPQTYDIYCFALTARTNAKNLEIISHALELTFWIQAVHIDHLRNFELLKRLWRYRALMPEALKAYAAQLDGSGGQEACDTLAFGPQPTEEEINLLFQLRPQLAQKLNAYDVFSEKVQNLITMAFSYIKEPLLININELIEQSELYTPERLADFMVWQMQNPEKLQLKEPLLLKNIDPRLVRALLPNREGLKVIATLPAERVLYMLGVEAGELVDLLCDMHRSGASVDKYEAKLVRDALGLMLGHDTVAIDQICSRIATAICAEPNLAITFFEELLEGPLLVRVIAEVKVDIEEMQRLLTATGIHVELRNYCHRRLKAISDRIGQQEKVAPTAEQAPVACAPAQTTTDDAIIGRQGKKIFITLDSGRILTVDLATEEVTLSTPVRLELKQ